MRKSPVAWLKQTPSDGNPPTYVTVEHTLTGWAVVTMTWNSGASRYERDGACGITHTSRGSGLRKDAVKEARGIAKHEEWPLYAPAAPVAGCAQCTGAPDDAYPHDECGSCCKYAHQT